MFINVCIKSKNKLSLIKFLIIFKNFINDKNFKLNKTLIFSQNKKINKVFTVLKSIHVNKTAQEQFEFNLFSKNIKIQTFQLLKLVIILKKIQTYFFSDINLKIKFFITKLYKKKLILKKINPNLIKLEPIKNFKQTKLYLILFNYYGKYTLYSEV